MRICGFSMCVCKLYLSASPLRLGPHAQERRARATRLVVVSLNFRMVAELRLTRGTRVMMIHRGGNSGAEM